MKVVSELDQAKLATIKQHLKAIAVAAREAQRAIDRGDLVTLANLVTIVSGNMVKIGQVHGA